MGLACGQSRFEQSLENHLSYPTNQELFWQTGYPWKLRDYKARLEAAEPSLFIRNDKAIDVPIRDLHYNGEYGSACTPADSVHPAPSWQSTVVREANITSLNQLGVWFGSEPGDEKRDQAQTGPVAAEEDPKCRFIYLFGRDSRARLKLSREMLTLILSYHYVMPEYLDFVFAFGYQWTPRDKVFNNFCSKILLSHPPDIFHQPALGRSGRHYQLCYNLYCVNLKSSGDDEMEAEWSIRQAAIHHQFDIIYGNTLWIVTKGGTDLQERFAEMTGPAARPEQKSFGSVYECFRSALSAHLMYCDWATRDWRWYLRWLEGYVEKLSESALWSRRRKYSPQDVQQLQLLKDKISEVIHVLEGNVNVMESLRMFYLNTTAREDFPKELTDECKHEVIAFNHSVGELINILKMQMTRAQCLSVVISDRRQLVIQRVHELSAERTEQLNANMEKETVRMRILTVVALIYLPATFVSTFFGADVVKYQNQNNSNGPNNMNVESFSPLALARWFQVTLPLTIATLLGAWLTYRSADSNEVHRKTESGDATSPSEKLAESKWRWKNIPAVLSIKHNKSENGTLPK